MTVRTLLLGGILLGVPARAEGGLAARCPPFVRTLLRGRSAPFDYDLFRAARQRYRGALRPGDPQADRLPTTPEERLAWLEVSARAGRDDSVTQAIDGVLEDEARAARLKRRLARFRETASWSTAEVESAFAELYWQAHGNPRAWHSLFRPGLAERVVLERVQRGLWHERTSQVLAELGLLRTPQAWERYGQWMARHQNPLGLAMALVANFSAHRLVALPTLDWVKGRKLSEALKAQIVAEGLTPEVRRELVRFYGARAWTDAAWNRAQRLVLLAVVGGIVWNAAIEADAGLGETKKLESAQTQAETVSHLDFEGVMVEAFVAQYRADHGRAPSPQAIAILRQKMRRRMGQARGGL